MELRDFCAFIELVVLRDRRSRVGLLQNDDQSDCDRDCDCSQYSAYEIVLPPVRLEVVPQKDLGVYAAVCLHYIRVII